MIFDLEKDMKRIIMTLNTYEITGEVTNDDIPEKIYFIFCRACRQAGIGKSEAVKSTIWSKIKCQIKTVFKR